MAGFDAAVGDGVGGAEAGHDFCRREHAHAEISVRHLEQRLGEGLGGAEDRIERLREARHQSPLDGRLGLGDGRRGNARTGGPRRRRLQKLAAVHVVRHVRFSHPRARARYIPLADAATTIGG